ncbi:PRC-barrel domain-containing protein [Rhodospirillaceae bacterium SYSU D60014]|uniref:PRC-barrel domain-containing protein n=1 Tax=Virgifigura deserti TaxID=2268457 RepID=UPI0013C5026C
MRRITAFSFASMLLTGVAATAPPSASAQQYHPYGQNQQQFGQYHPYDQPYGPGDRAQQPGQFGQGGQTGMGQMDMSQMGMPPDMGMRMDMPPGMGMGPGMSPQMGMPYEQGDRFRQYSQDQQRDRQFGPEAFGQAGRYQQYGSRDQYGFPPFDPNDRALRYGSREQYGFPPYREGSQEGARQYGQPRYGQGQDRFARDYRGPQGFDQYALGQQRSIQDRERAFQERFGPDSAYHQFGQLEPMPQPSMSNRDQGLDTAAPGRILLTSASELVGRTVRDLDGERAGEVEYLMIDALAGDVSYVILGAGRGLDIGADYVAVPWSAVVVRPEDERRLALDVSRDRLMQAPRLSENELAELTNPALLAHVTNFYAVPEGQSGQEAAGQAQSGQTQSDRTQGSQTQGAQGQQQAQSEQGQQQAQSEQGQQQGEQQIRRLQQSLQKAEQSLQRDDTQGAKQALDQATQAAQQAIQQAMEQPSDRQQRRLQRVFDSLQQAHLAIQQDNPDQARQALAQAQQPLQQGAAQQQGQGQTTRQQAQSQQGWTQQAVPSGGPGQPAILVGRRVATMLHPPVLVSPTALRGTQVVAPNGRPIGAIDQVMIDVERGHVAFVLLASGGFLGMDQNWIPVPFQSLEWLAEAQTYVLAADPQQLMAMPALPPERLPVMVSGHDLAMLHAQFGVMPYWQPPTAVAQFEQGGTTQEARISPDEVREMLRRQGFTEISDLSRDGGSYEVTAQRSDQTYDLEIDAETGIIESSRLTPAGIRTMLQRQGYSEISDLSREGNTYIATAQSGDRQVELQIDARTGTVQTESGS